MKSGEGGQDQQGRLLRLSRGGPAAAPQGFETCQTGLRNLPFRHDKHLEDSANKPVTSLELSTCGGCHKDQFDSFYRMNYDAQGRKEKGGPTGPFADAG